MLAAAGLWAALGAQGAWAGPWSPTRVVQGTFAASSPPEAPGVAMNALGHAVMAWNATGPVRVADRWPDGTWGPSFTVPGGSAGSGLVAVAIGRGDLTAVAWTTVATRYVPSKLMVSVRPAGGAFGAPVEVAPGTSVGALQVGVQCSGAITVLWTGRGGVSTTTLDAPSPPAGTCSGASGAGAWPVPVTLSSGTPVATAARLAVGDGGVSLATWVEAPVGQPGRLVAARRDGTGPWQAALPVAPATAQPLWNPMPACDAVGNAQIAWQQGPTVQWAEWPAGLAGWQPAQTLSGAQSISWSALAVDDAGDALVAWQAIDAPSGAPSIWQRMRLGRAWGPALRLSARADASGWPSVAFSGDGSVAIVGWIDDATLAARASRWQGGTWTRSTLGPAWWGGTVPVAAGGGRGIAGWAQVVGGNPNAARLVGRGTP